MLSAAHKRPQFAGEDGGVILMVAIWLGVLVLLASFVIDIGNWFEHKRHLQLQADAGALAGGGSFNQCFGSDLTGSGIEAEARRYAGSYSGAYNEQVGGSNRGTVYTRLNRKTYEVGGPGPDDTIESNPCAAGMIDVKMTEAGLPFFFGLAGSLVPSINAQARVSLFHVSTRRNNLPIAAPDVNVVRAEARFVDEDTDPPALLGSQELFSRGLSNGLIVWSADAPSDVIIGSNTKNIGVRIVLSGSNSLDCDAFLVECFDASRDNGGLVYLRGWTAAGSGAAPAPPLARRVSLSPVSGACTSSAFFSDRAPCSQVQVTAVVDIGARLPADVDIWAEGGDCIQGNTSRCHLEFQPPDLVAFPEFPNGRWTTTGATGSPQKQHVAILAGTDDRIGVTLHWAITSGFVGTQLCEPNKPCKGTFEGGLPVQRTFGGAVDLSGAIKAIAVTDPISGMEVDQLERPAVETPFPLEVRIGLLPNYQNARDINDPIVSLRVAREVDAGGTSTSRNKAIDCDPQLSNLRDEITYGCAPAYTINRGTTCLDPNDLWSSPQPWNCVKVETGGAAGQVTQGMTLRILNGGTTCAQHPNNWNLYPNFPEGDTRIVTVMLTIFGAFGGQGQGTVPVTGFGHFYVTGWPKSGNNRRETPVCSGDDSPVPKGHILGHFIDYTDDFNTSGGDGPCPFLDPNYSGVGSCVAVLTR